MKPSDSVDALVIGGGFYGSTIARWLKRETTASRVLIVEQEDDLLTRSSWANQARIHNGYHYPRSFITAWRSRVNYDKFLCEYATASTVNSKNCTALHGGILTSRQTNFKNSAPISKRRAGRRRDVCYVCSIRK